MRGEPLQMCTHRARPHPDHGTEQNSRVAVFAGQLTDTGQRLMVFLMAVALVREGQLPERS